MLTVGMKPIGFTSSEPTARHTLRGHDERSGLSRATALAAIQREKNIKHWSRARKVELIRSLNPDWRDLWDDIVR
jgi:hypothetical protein